ncbi:MAG: radical SAM protein [Deltaproteobacteria bacterium]|nr:radical SAM protein [Deltaproteobacteria bacterium]
MKVLFANVPFVKYDAQGRIRTGPNAGSRWPWTLPGYTDYAPFPFFMAYAVSYLLHHGIEALFYDAVASKDWDLTTVRENISGERPDILVLETATPTYRIAADVARWAKRELNCKIVLVGPHLKVFAQEVIKEPFVDHCVVGEYEHPILDIVLNGPKALSIYIFDHLDSIDDLDGVNFVPFRPLSLLMNYWDPATNTSRPQLQMYSARGCPFQCSYCQWPTVMHNYKYRVRKAELVIDEINTVIKDYKEFFSFSRKIAHLAQGMVKNPRSTVKRAFHEFVNHNNNPKFCSHTSFEIGSIFFDDDTWNVGEKRVASLCNGLKRIGLPWTMMGRTDTISNEIYDLMVDTGCVGMRFGIESFQQRLLDTVNKRMDARKNYETIKYLLTRFSNMEFHFTTMKNLPGETEEEWQKDREVLQELKSIGERSCNIVHWQTSDCIAFPGTPMWEAMVNEGKGTILNNFDLYDGSPDNDIKQAKMLVTDDDAIENPGLTLQERELTR